MAETGVADPVTPPNDAVSERRERSPSSLAGWGYLVVLLAVFVGLALWANQQGGATESSLIDTSTSSPTVAPALEPALVTLTVDRAVATLQGSVPDEGARQQLLRIAEEQFGRGNVVDELTVDPGVDLATGIFSVGGRALTGDLSPELVQLTAGADLGLAAGPFEVQFVAPNVNPAEIVMTVGGDTVLIAGTVPDEAAVTRVRLTAEAVYGEGNVDTTGLEIATTTLDGASILISGLTAPGDRRAVELAEVAVVDFSSASVTDESKVDVSDEALDAFEAQLAEALRANPILFDVGTSRLTDEGLANLVPIAASINAIPELGVEVVGHTDNTGGESVNQTLSESRAEAVSDALIELGVDPARLSTRGAGASEPIASNDTREGRQLNRRIQFIFERLEGE